MSELKAKGMNYYLFIHLFQCFLLFCFFFELSFFQLIKPFMPGVPSLGLLLTNAASDQILHCLLQEFSFEL